ncbi:tryptophan 2,3-dioxygenase family protein [Spongiactinospora sp. TRM90649]|uniref:tryptophan 2,3-dioxygenase n=1 Tax=Spongiactinospora sp. TRM90649 TaxID=3031114 RepID=UPI0023F9B4C3|nr:tryptophan 2,3-dioxygenase family protein [Spongiactinospora sp. TRM90649]MDF5754233.1 tryptophan 2,3-dioxygenase family protein [Spongiactinospora sp. TRM90649]
MRAPAVDFAHATPYDEYVGTGLLRALPGPRTDSPEEPVFLVTTRVMELYFGLIRTELRLVLRSIAGDDAPAATAALVRVTRYLEAVNAAWAAFDRLTPPLFNAFRAELGEASGFQSAMYRQIEFMLGDRTGHLAQVHRGDPALHEELLAALRGPSVYDAALALLDRRGMPIPAGTLGRDPAEPYRPDPAVEHAWVRVYTERGPGDDLWEFAEAMTDVAERFAEWRYRHLVTVRRAMGAKIGTGGSSGAEWLARSLTREIFPELWSARTAM